MIFRLSEQLARQFFSGIVELFGRKLWPLFSLFFVTLLLASWAGYTEVGGAQIEDESAQAKIAELEAELGQLQDATVALINASRDLVSGSRDPRYQEIDIEYYGLWAAHNLNVFRWTVWESRILLAVVLLVVSCGLYFAYIQLRSAVISGDPSVKGGENVSSGQSLSSESSGTAFEFSLSSIKITSSIVGLVILSFSLGFFYLYLTEVYPLRFINPNGGEVLHAN